MVPQSTVLIFRQVTGVQGQGNGFLQTRGDFQLQGSRELQQESQLQQGPFWSSSRGLFFLLCVWNILFSFGQIRNNDAVGSVFPSFRPLNPLRGRPMMFTLEGTGFRKISGEASCCLARGRPGGGGGSRGVGRRQKISVARGYS